MLIEGNITVSLQYLHIMPHQIAFSLIVNVVDLS